MALVGRGTVLAYSGIIDHILQHPRGRGTMRASNKIKTSGYLVSAISVVLLGSFP